MASTDHFAHELLAQLRRGADGGAIDILINSGELHRSLGSLSGSAQGLPNCCDAMQAEMKLGDTLILDRTNGAGMTILYLLPRVAH